MLEIPLPGVCPQPLRNKVHPMGLPGLSAQDQARVDAANLIYVQVSKFFHRL